MTDEVPFFEAERVFNKVLDLVESHVETVAPGGSVGTYTFAFMAGLSEYRHIVAHFRDAYGSEGRLIVLLPSSTGYTRPAADGFLFLDLTGQEVELLTDLVWLGACTGFWYVENIADVKGEVKQRPYTIMGSFMAPSAPPTVDPLAFLSAFGGGELEQMWPERRAIIEKGWFIWQARMQQRQAEWDDQIAQQGGGRAQELWSPDEAGTPDYLR